VVVEQETTAHVRFETATQTHSQVEMMTENLRINNNVLNAAHQCGVDRVVSMTSTCVFPDKVCRNPYPLKRRQRSQACILASAFVTIITNIIHLVDGCLQVQYPISEDMMHDGPPHP
jgi:nucleoside-diphosphate-sugar epimerase